MSDTPDTKSAPAAPKDRPHVFAVRIVDEGTAPNDGVRAVTQFMEARPPPEPLDERTVILAGRRLRVVLRGPCYLDAPIESSASAQDTVADERVTPISRKQAVATIDLENAVDVLRRMKDLAITPNEQQVRLTVDGMLRHCVEYAEIGLETCIMGASPTVARRLAGAGLTVRRQFTFEEPFIGGDALRQVPMGGFGPVLDPQNDADWDGASDDIRMDAHIHYRVSWAKEPA